MAKLVLFDIYATLIYSDGVGRRALGRALSEVFGVASQIQGVKFSGRTDPQICREILAKAGVPAGEIALGLPQAFGVYTRYLQEEINLASNFSLHEGVSGLLSALAGMSCVYLGLVTGNIEDAARIKLTHFNLNDYFAIGAFGSDFEDRRRLPGLARYRACLHFRLDFEAADLVIVGDSVNDVDCARWAGARSLAVNTGVTSHRELEEACPDYLLESLSDTQAVIEAIIS